MFIDSLVKTMRHFGIKNTRLAEVYCCHPDYLSKIRCGKRSPQLNNFWELLQSMELLCPGSLVYYCRLLCGREEDFLVEDVIATLDPEEIVYYLPAESLPEFSAAVKDRLHNLPSMQFNYIDSAEERDLPALTNSLVNRLRSRERLYLLLEAIGDEDLPAFLVMLAQRIARKSREVK